MDVDARVLRLGSVVTGWEYIPIMTMALIGAKDEGIDRRRLCANSLPYGSLEPDRRPMTVNLEKYLRLNSRERRIVLTAAKVGPTPSTLSLLRVYFPGVSDDDLKWLIAEIGKQRDE